MFKLPAVLSLACAATGAFAEPVAYPATDAELAAALANLRAAEDAERRANADFEALRARNALTQADLEAYQIYLRHLRETLETNRIAVSRMTAQPVGSTHARRETEPEAGASGIRSGASTHEESLRQLDGELRESLSEFDAMLLREMQELAERETAAGDTSTAGDADGSDGGPQGQTTTATDAGGAGRTASWEEVEGSQGEAGDRTAGAAETTQASEEDTAGGATRPGHGPRSAPTGLPDGSDDDVVARQLREAAEKETDPELKKKLWEEYRKYKAGA